MEFRSRQHGWSCRLASREPPSNGCQAPLERRLEGFGFQRGNFRCTANADPAAPLWPRIVCAVKTPENQCHNPDSAKPLEPPLRGLLGAGYSDHRLIDPRGIAVQFKSEI